jgi:ribosomal peptide maturation radical SAM protein 1
MMERVDPQQQAPEILLFSMPWMKGDWPCLGIATVKSYVEAAGIAVRCCHFHLDAAARLSLNAYNALAETWGAGEALFAALLDQDQTKRLTAYAAEELQAKGYNDVAEWARGGALAELSALVDLWIDENRIDEATIVGGSVGALQLCGTLLMMRRLKERGHSGLRVLGGSGLVGSVATEVLRRASFVDFIVHGEGEQAFLDFVRAVRDGGVIPDIAGVLQRDRRTGEVKAASRSKPICLAGAPAPDLTEFFNTAARLGVPRTALTLSIEHSRGCEWEHRTPGQLRGCTFCGLYRNSPNFRRKPVAHIVGHLRDNVARYRNLNLAFVDAYLPEADRDELIDAINALPEDVTFFSELRCDLTAETVIRLARRARRVQLGVESFSTALLRRIGKGLTAAQSAYCVRLCQEAGISTQYNLMLHIPGATQDEIAGLHADLPTLFGLLPPEVTRFYLDRNSLAFEDPAGHGIAPDSLDAKPHPWLPGWLADGHVSQVVPFRPVSDALTANWDSVGALVEQWQDRWHAARKSGVASPLTWQLGVGWAAIVDLRQQREQVYEIEDALFDVFHACDSVMSVATLTNSLPQRSLQQIEQTLEELVGMGLIFRDGPRYVRVAIRTALGPLSEASCGKRPT